jgi:hypothetical protein
VPAGRAIAPCPPWPWSGAVRPPRTATQTLGWRNYGRGRRRSAAPLSLPRSRRQPAGVLAAPRPTPMLARLRPGLRPPVLGTPPHTAGGLPPRPFRLRPHAMTAPLLDSGKSY